MDEINPLLQGYPEPPPSCSKKVFCIAGIRLWVYGLDELTDTTDVVCLWLLHPRLLTQMNMEPLAFSTIHAWHSHAAQHYNHRFRPGMIAASFDQRNHGSREIEPRANEAWRSGNETHAQDMFSIYRSLLIKTFPVSTD